MAKSYYLRFGTPTASIPSNALGTGALDASRDFLSLTDHRLDADSRFYQKGDYEIYDLVQPEVTTVNGAAVLGEGSFSVADADVAPLLRALFAGRVFSSQILGFSEAPDGKLAAELGVVSGFAALSRVSISGETGAGVLHRFDVGYGTLQVIEDSTPRLIDGQDPDDNTGKTITTVDTLQHTQSFSQQPGAEAVLPDSERGEAEENDLHYFMKVTQAGETNWVEIDAFSLEIDQTIALSSQTAGAGAGRALLSDLVVTRAVDNASLRFQKLFATEAATGRIDIQAFQNFGTTAQPQWLAALERLPNRKVRFAPAADTYGQVQSGGVKRLNPGSLPLAQ